jgi:mannose-6-phosphate isomerase-like protein (cupin superfamily)
MTTGADYIDLATLANGEPRQPAWAYAGEDLNANLLVFDAGDGVPEHVNLEVDVLVVGIAGAGTVTVDDEIFTLAAGRALAIPKGARRGTQATSARFAYLTCHRRRGGLWPRRAARAVEGHDGTRGPP